MKFWVGFNEFGTLAAAKQYATDRLRRGDFYDTRRPHIAVYSRRTMSTAPGGEKLVAVVALINHRPKWFGGKAWRAFNDRQPNGMWLA